MAAIAQRESELKLADVSSTALELLKENLYRARSLTKTRRKKLTAEAALTMEQARKVTAEARLPGRRVPSEPERSGHRSSPRRNRQSQDRRRR